MVDVCGVHAKEWMRVVSGSFRRYTTFPMQSVIWKGPKKRLDSFGWVCPVTER